MLACYGNGQWYECNGRYIHSSDCSAEVAEPGSYGCCGRSVLQARLTAIGLDPDRKYFEGSVGSAHDTVASDCGFTPASSILKVSSS